MRVGEGGGGLIAVQGGLAGGCHLHPDTWKENPAYELRLRRDGDGPPPAACVANVTLRRPAGVRGRGVM